MPASAPIHARDEAGTGPGIGISTGGYRIQFTPTSGAITVSRPGRQARLVIRELGSSKKTDLLYSVRSVRHTGSSYTLSGAAAWASFTFHLAIEPSVPGLVHLTLSLTPTGNVPPVSDSHPDVRVVGSSAADLTLYDPAPPIAGTSVFLSSKRLDSSILYLADLTSLGQFFQRTQTGASQPNFDYPRAGGKGALIGLSGSYFGYPPPLADLGSLPRKRPTRVIDSYLYLLPGVPSGEASVAGTYLKVLGTVYEHLPKPTEPGADWHALAIRTATDLNDPSNLVDVGGDRYLVSYVSDTRKSPELITQAAVLAGIKAYESRYHESVPLEAVLDDNLPSFYDSTFHTVKNGLGHDPAATEESWYYITNLISLLQLSQLGDAGARRLLMESAPAAEALAHANMYEFPQDFAFGTWSGQQTGLQPDVAGGYAWLMLGLYDLTKDDGYLREAEASIRHVEGKGFRLAYETHMLGYTAAAAERLFRMTNDLAYHADAQLALANLFHVTRLWDCAYALCRKGSGYHTYFGINPLPWADYIAPLEQYEAWLGLRDYVAYANGEPAYVLDLVRGFLAATPLTLQYSLPTRLPSGVATTSPGEYAFVSRNNLSWDIPLEDLRTGEQNSGVIGQEIYGAGAPFMLAAYGP